MKKAIFICTCLLLLGVSMPNDDAILCSPAVIDDKEAAITELLCIEDHNKNLVLQRNKYFDLLGSIRGQDGSDCLAIRCINQNELLLELTTIPENATLTANLGGDVDNPVTSVQPSPLKFKGILGKMPRGAIVDDCQSNYLSYLQLTASRDVTITSIKLKLHYTDDSYKVVFEDKTNKRISAGGRLVIRKDEILANKAFIQASAGSCQDN